MHVLMFGICRYANVSLQLVYDIISRVTAYMIDCD